MTATFLIDLPLPMPALRVGEQPPVLKGRLTLGADPPGPPSFFLVPSPGLGDGDGNDSDLGFGPLAQWAEALGAAGFSSLRCDRRGTGATGGEYVGPTTAIDDLQAVLTQDPPLPELPPPWVLLGQGESAAWAALLASRLPALVRGLVLIAPPAGPVGDIFRYRQEAEQLLAIAPP